MGYTCGSCGREFTAKLDLKLHRDRCTVDQLFCQECGGRFPEAEATDDGWRYRCPNDDCEGEGLKEDLYPVNDVKLIAQ